MNDIIEMIKERKLEMLQENHKLERQRQILTAELSQVNSQLLVFDIELKVLFQWEDRLAPKEKK